MYAVEATAVSRRFGRRVAVDNLTLQISPGEIVGFLGLNGAGKTTTLRMLAGQLHPDEGTVRVFEYDTQARGFAAHGLVGVLPEDAAIRVTATAWENLLRAAESRYVRPEEALRRGRELFALLGLDDRADEPVRGFSKGMKRRLGIAMSVINYPLLLVLDEPTSGLDVESVAVIRDVVRELNRRGVTILMTTHAIEEANGLCDRVAILDRGRLAACDTPARLKASVPHDEPSLLVTFLPDAPNVADEIRRLPAVTAVSGDGGRYRVDYTDLPGVLEALAAYSRRTSRTIAALQMSAPSLEEVFFHVTGSDLRSRPAASVRWTDPAMIDNEGGA
ncbi:MAG: type transport system ATP-binding protein [Euryarchaeota archaeon]|nr:type transport system ATP-binding protein [Euryarchaeota archaeon]MDN5339797.1 type transport system ATP-binding protein [Euryarchaeota archaeon]